MSDNYILNYDLHVDVKGRGGNLLNWQFFCAVVLTDNAGHHLEALVICQGGISSPVSFKLNCISD